MSTRISILFSFLLLIACNDSKKSDASESVSTPEQTATTLKKGSGIGPVKAFRLPDEVDAAMAETGKQVFTQKCTACHIIGKKLIGPDLTGVVDRRRPEWIMNMIMNPIEMLSKDPEAKALLAEYNNLPMTNQNVPQDEARALLEYFRTLQ
ncbi:MAG: cytochrome C [Bacteroidetes bacterium HGW-Bacteroidetes-13]|jgi:mono/diheme cytochrome c family protein|nr:MAG: cytochrome C [Bacteroidetes bacterium HGW-Bacteroidetes-13]